MIVSETWSRGRRRSIACRGRDREQGPRRQEEDGGADQALQALPGRPPAVSLLACKICEVILASWGAAGQGLVGAAVFLLPPRSLFAVSLATSYGNAVAPYSTFRLRSHCVKRCLPEAPASFGVYFAHVPKCTRLFSLSGQRSYAYVSPSIRAEEGEPGNEASLCIAPCSSSLHTYRAPRKPRPNSPPKPRPFTPRACANILRLDCAKKPSEHSMLPGYLLSKCRVIPSRSMIHSSD